ncbi:MAG: hypothetical protein C0497_09510 [Gemmatimonas sp.]|nr:hypothetical protein [Gemmatimonas sp.]
MGWIAVRPAGLRNPSEGVGVWSASTGCGRSRSQARFRASVLAEFQVRGGEPSRNRCNRDVHWRRDGGAVHGDGSYARRLRRRQHHRPLAPGHRTDRRPAPRSRLSRGRGVGGRRRTLPRRRHAARHDPVHRVVRVGRRAAQHPARLEAPDLFGDRISQLSQPDHASRRHLSRVHGACARRMAHRVSPHHRTRAARRDPRPLHGMPRRVEAGRRADRRGQGMRDGAERMEQMDALRALHAARRADDVVITSMGAARDWMVLGAGPLDLPLVPSSMGTAPTIGLGLALAQPARRVIVVNGDGAMLMNLGSLVTITAAAPANLILILADNGVYEVTDAQPTPGSPGARADGTSVDFEAIARACGFRSVFHFRDAERWATDVVRVLDATGPTFVLLDVGSVPGSTGPRSPGPAAARAVELRRQLSAAAKLPGPTHP